MGIRLVTQTINEKAFKEAIDKQTITMEADTKRLERIKDLETVVEEFLLVLNKALLLQLRVFNSFALLKLLRILASFSIPQLCDLHEELQRNCGKELEGLGFQVVFDFGRIGVIQGRREECLMLQFGLILLLIEFYGCSIVVLDNFDSLFTILL